MFSIIQKVGLVAVATGSFSLVAASVQAGTIFSQTQTGLDLFNNPDVTFPTTAPTINGSSLDFGTGTTNDALLVWDLLPAGERGELDISIEVDYDPLSGDNDPIFALFDGSNYLGVIRTDGQQAVGVRGNGTPTQTLNLTVEAGGATGLGPVEPYSFDLWLADEAAGASLNNFVEGSDSAPGPFPYTGNFIDTDQALSLVMYRPIVNGGSERYRLNSVSITVDDKKTAPEPAAALALLGLGAAAVAKRFSKSKQD